MPGPKRDPDDIKREYRTGVLGGHNYPYMAGERRDPDAEFDEWLLKVRKEAFIAGGVFMARDQGQTAPDSEPFLRDALAERFDALTSTPD